MNIPFFFAKNSYIFFSIELETQPNKHPMLAMFPLSKRKAWKFLFCLMIFAAIPTTNDMALSYQDGHFSQKELFFSPRAVKEYTSYSDIEIFTMNLPELTTEVKVYFSINSESSVCKQSSVEVYYDYGAPPMPPYQTFPNGTLKKREFAGNIVISTDTKDPLRFKEPLPGTWYIGVLVPKSNGIKKRRELGFGDSSSDSCSFSVGLKAVITVLDAVSFLPSEVEIRDGLPFGQMTRYYRHSHQNTSSHLIVEISGCYSIKKDSSQKLPGFCPLNLSVRSRALPTEGKSLSVACTDQSHDYCSVIIPTWEQQEWMYYITTTKFFSMKAYQILYNISVTEVGCSEALPGLTIANTFDPACVPVQEMSSTKTGKVLNVKFTTSKSNNSILLPGNRPTFFSLEVSPYHVGSMLSAHLALQSGSYDKTLMCLQKDFPPLFYQVDNYYAINCSGQLSSVSENNRASSIHVPFPGEGIWYISLYTKSSHSFATIGFYAEMQACSSNCNNQGTCNIRTKPDIVFGECSCDAGYEGWACDQDNDVDLVRVMLLTLSNVAFLIDAGIAVRKQLYPETLVYLFLLVISTLYHLCGSRVFCAMDEPFLQTCDLFAILLSVWVTLVILTNHRVPAVTPTLNMLAVLVLFVSVQEAKRSILPFVLTVSFGVLLVIVYNVSLWCQKVPTASFSKKRWALFILPAAIMILMSFLCFALLETEDNYKYIHSLGHALLGFGIALLLPNHRPYARRGHYDMIRELDSETTREESSSRRNLVNEVRHV